MSLTNFFFLYTFIVASVTTRQTSLPIIWEHSADTCIPSQITMLRIKPHFMYREN